MANGHNFEHLPLLLRYEGTAKLKGGGKTAPQSVANRGVRRQQHSQELIASAGGLTQQWQQRRANREADALPALPPGVPLLLQVDPGLDLDVLRDRFAFEIVAEQEEGYVIVASEDIDLASFVALANNFAVEVHGSAAVAQVHRLFDDPDQTERLRRVLSDRLFAEWPNVVGTQQYVVDIGVACVGDQDIPNRPSRGKRDTDASWAQKEATWSQARNAAYEAWDAIKVSRETEVEQFVAAYAGEILHLVDGAAFDAAVLPDSFTVRVRIVGAGLKDLVLNYPYVFEVVEPEDIALPQAPVRREADGAPPVTPLAPDPLAPAVCVIDSGIQEGHVLLQPAIDATTSRCFLPDHQPGDVGDYVRPGGHGTRVAGAVLYGEEVAKVGAPQLPYWIQNARVLNQDNQMPVDLFPPVALRAVVEHFHQGPRQTRIFNHSINAHGSCRTRYMSAWAAEIDVLSASHDILLIQSAGNLYTSHDAPYIGVKEHLDAGRLYPLFLTEASARVANPGQSLQALTVGSVSYGALTDGEWSTFAGAAGHPSAFSRAGFGIWNVIKPEVVEFGGDFVRTGATPLDVQPGGRIAEACPDLVRSTMYPPGPAADRDDVGTSFAAPKVARVAAMLQRLFPDQPALLYRGLIALSARWPAWADDLLAQLRGADLTAERREEIVGEVSRAIRVLGYGVPNEERATSNTEFRTTLITDGETSIKARECHIYQVPVPAVLRAPADEVDVRIDVCLSYVAAPRRTRRNLRRYLSTWVDWKSSKLGEGIDTFRLRAMKDEPVDDAAPLPGQVLPWALHESATSGLVRETRRSSGTLQKDWAVVKSNALPEHFCIAVVGHQGWSRDPDSAARYSLAVTFEVLGQEIPIYEPIRTAVLELQAQLGSAEIEEELEIDVAE